MLSTPCLISYVRMGSQPGTPSTPHTPNTHTHTLTNEPMKKTCESRERKKGEKGEQKIFKKIHKNKKILKKRSEVIGLHATEVRIKLKKDPIPPPPPPPKKKTPPPPPPIKIKIKINKKKKRKKKNQSLRLCFITLITELL